MKGGVAVQARLNPNASARCEDGITIDTAWKPVGVTAQFMENAETYFERCHDDPYWRYLIGRAFRHVGLAPDSRAHVLDIGSGSGNSVFAMAAEFPGVSIVASDISPPMLRILKRVASTSSTLEGRLSCYCFDLHTNFFEAEQFDYVVGGAILHHMLDPLAALTNVVKWLRPGGVIALFEPLEIGAHVMCALYQVLRDELAGEGAEDMLRFFDAMTTDYEARFGVPRVKPWTPHLDDKWVFNPRYLRELCRDLGCSELTILPISDDLSHVFEQCALGTARAAGCVTDNPSPRMLAIIREFDEGIAPALKRRMIPDGIVLLKK